jgi:hypothetical protein
VKTSDVLRKAGDVLRERGWYQGYYKAPDGSVCVLGAMSETMLPATLWDRAIDVADTVAGTDNLARWNDATGRTVEEVLIAMDAAYVVALQEEGIEPGDVL